MVEETSLAALRSLVPAPASKAVSYGDGSASCRRAALAVVRVNVHGAATRTVSGPLDDPLQTASAAELTAAIQFVRHSAVGATYGCDVSVMAKGMACARAWCSYPSRPVANFLGRRRGRWCSDAPPPLPPPHRAPFYKVKARASLRDVACRVTACIDRTDNDGDILQQQLRRRGILGLNRLEPVSNVWKSWSRWRPHGVVTVRREPRCATFLYGRFGLSNEDVQVAAQHVNHRQKFRRTRPGSATQLANTVSSTESCQRAALSQVKTKHMTGRPGTPQPGGHGLWDIVVRGRTLKALSVTTGLLRFVPWRSKCTKELCAQQRIH